MAYDLATVRNRVLDDKLDDTSYDPEIVDRFINDTQRAIFNLYELPFMEKVFSGLLPAGESIFEFPLDYQLAQMLILVDSNSASVDLTHQFIPFDEFFRAFPDPESTDAGRPSVWTSHGNKIYLNRPTDDSYTLKLFYIKAPDLLDDDNDVPEIPESFSEVLVLGAYYRILERNEDFDQAAFIKNGDYLDELEKMVARLGKRQVGKPNVMGQPRRMVSRRRI
jgi:hypothetical protein